MKKFVVWRWAKKTTRFVIVQNKSWGNRCNYGDYSNVVFAGLKPTDWMWIGRSRSGPLHKILLTEEQAKLCVVAEQNFKPSIEELETYVKGKGIRLIGSYKRYCAEKYPNSFIPLTEYCGEHNVPEVLIPFEIDAYPQYIMTFWLNFRARFIDQTLRKAPPVFKE